MLVKVVLTLVAFGATCSNATLPSIEAPKSYAPNVPPPITRSYQARLQLSINVTITRGKLSPSNDYDFWAYDGHVPGPFIRARVGDYLDVTFTNTENTSVSHDIDFHAVSGPGGGAPQLKANPGQTVNGSFQLLYPGLFIYHCGVDPAAYHLANGLYGLILVEPAEGLPKVDREYFIVRSEFYTQSDGATLLKLAYQDGLDEKPSHVVFNGRTDSLTSQPLTAKTDERVRIFFGNAGPNQIASYHIIGVILDQVYRDADLISPPGRGIQTILVAAGGATVVEFKTLVPGTYTMVDHSLFRLIKGAAGLLKVDGPARYDVYCSNTLNSNITCGIDENITTFGKQYVDKNWLEEKNHANQPTSTRSLLTLVFIAYMTSAFSVSFSR